VTEIPWWDERPAQMAIRRGKHCTKCGQLLPAEAFPANERLKTKLSSHCRSCHAESVAAWRRTHQEQVDEYNRRRREKYAEAARADGRVVRPRRSS
jgi:hypothetical protein